MAIGAHGMWKTRLKSAIDHGSSEFSPAVVQLDDHCDFGKWLAGASPELKASPLYSRCRDLHRQFHSAAAKVLTLALSGKKDKAKHNLDSGEFSNLSGTLTKTMMDWDKAI
jgi:hypothetical protein